MHKLIRQLFFTPKCKCCGRLSGTDNLCHTCRQKLEKCRVKNAHLPTNKKIDFVNGLYASYFYKDSAKEIIKRAKFKNPSRFLNSFLDDISIDIKQILEQNNIDMVIAVPSYKTKLYTQEYDLPVEMAKQIADHFGVQYSQCVTKVKKTKIQHNLPKNQRKANVVNAFAVTGDVSGKNILLTDDVVTTGFTVSAIATELKLAGRNNVYVWVYTLNT